MGELLDPPVATIAMEDISNTQFLVENLDIGECLEGDLFADIEVIRGIRNMHGDYTHIRREKIYSIQLGIIACHESCLSCNGTEFNECEICAD